ncbi:MAG: TolC family protein [Bacteroidales bacterium]|nr:TolC family protein [Bacteroidales bacterium]
MKNRRAILSIFALLISLSGIGQQAWSLDDCISYALKNNLQMQQQQLEVTRSENNLLQSKLNFLPSISAGASENLNWGRSVDMQELIIVKNNLTTSTSVNLSGQLTLFDGLSKLNSLKSSYANLDKAHADVAVIKQNLTINITKAYLQLLLAKEILSITQESYASILVQQEKIAKSVEAGNQAYSALLEIAAQVASERSQVVEAEGNVATARLDLMQQLDLEPSDTFEVEMMDVTAAATLASPEDYLNLDYITGNPQIKSAEYALKKSQIELSSAKGRLFPSLILSAGYGTYYSDAANKNFKEQFSSNQNPSMGLSLSIPIFNGFQRATNVKNAKLNVSASELELKNKRMSLSKEIQSAITQANNSHQRSLAARENMLSSEESFRMTEKKYSLGAATITDYIVSKTNMTKAQSDYCQSCYQYIFQLKVLDCYLNEKEE